MMTVTAATQAALPWSPVSWSLPDIGQGHDISGQIIALANRKEERPKGVLLHVILHYYRAVFYA